MIIRRSKLALALAAASVFATPALAQPVVDGVLDAEYGLPDSAVVFSPTAPTGNFQSPTPFSNTANYTISLTSDANSVFGFLQADRDTGLQFANLYFGLNGAGSNLGFEISRNGVNAFRPGRAGNVTLDGSLYDTAFTADGLAIEFSLANSLFLAPIAGLDQSGQVFPTPGSNVRLNLSQSFGFSVAGGAAYGPNRLGVVQVGEASAVPEPGSWALMIVGIGAVGSAMRYRRRKTAVAFA